MQMRFLTLLPLSFIDKENIEVNKMINDKWINGLLRSDLQATNMQTKVSGKFLISGQCPN